MADRCSKLKIIGLSAGQPGLAVFLCSRLVYFFQNHWFFSATDHKSVTS